MSIFLVVTLTPDVNRTYIQGRSGNLWRVADRQLVKVVNLEIEIVDDNCTGCYRCERVCPTGAIAMVGPRTEALAVVDNDNCIACFRCIDSCDDDAMFAVPRDEPLQIVPPFDGLDPTDVLELCRAADLDPDQLACACSSSPTKELAAVILDGATSFEEVALRTGAQSGCLMYCSVPIRRLLLAHTGQADSTAHIRRYPLDLALRDVPAEAAHRYPLFNVLEEQRHRRDYLDSIDVEL
jgi:ferredoxin